MNKDTITIALGVCAIFALVFFANNMIMLHNDMALRTAWDAARW